MKCGLSLAILFTVAASSTMVWAQNEQAILDRVRPKLKELTPNAASLGKYGDYSATAYNGLPEVSIPLFEATSGVLKVPVSLTYHASGFKITDHASWVGLGWSLNAGGQITRTQRGKRDEDGFAQNTEEPLRTTLDPCGNPSDLSYLQGVANGVYDTQPDIWSYSFPGKSGKFLIQSRNTNPPILVPREPLQVTFGGGRTTIVDDAGVAYYFGGSSDGSAFGDAPAMEGSNNGPSGGTNSLYLSDIVAPNSDDRIQFGYQLLGNFTSRDVSQSVMIKSDCNSPGGTGFNCPPQLPGTILETEPTIFTGAVGISEIRFEGGKARFIKQSITSSDLSTTLADELQYYLKSVEVYSTVGGVDVLTKLFKLRTSFFKNASGTRDMQLKLDGIDVYDVNNNLVSSYNFDYTTTRVPWESWSEGKYKRDYWGFYNGANGASNQDLFLPVNTSYVYTTSSPTSTTPLIFGTANRLPDTTLVKSCLLKKINFPTGGSSEFFYQSNRYMQDGVSTYGGGVRVMKIVTSDGIQPASIKTYVYGNGPSSQTSGAGNANFSLQNFQYVNEQVQSKSCCLGDGACGAGVAVGTMTYKIKTWFANNGVSSEGYGGAPVVYPYVTENWIDGTGAKLGSTLFQYDNGNYLPAGPKVYAMVGGGSGNSGQSSLFYINSIAWKSGMLTNKTVRAANGNLVSTSSINYQLFNEAILPVGLMVGFVREYELQICDNSCLTRSQDLAWTQVTQTTGAYREVLRTETVYQADGVTGITTTTATAYDPTYFLPIKKSTSKSSGALDVTEMVYPFNYVTNAGTTGDAKGIHLLKAKNVISVPIEQYTYVLRTDDKRLTSATLTTYRVNENNATQIVPDKVYTAKFTGAVQVGAGGFVPSSVNGSNNGLLKDTRYVDRVTISSFDPAGNPLVLSKTKDLPYGYVYGYDGSRVIAELSNAQRATSLVQTTVPGLVSEAVAVYGQITVGSPSVQYTRTFTTSQLGTVTLTLGVPGSPGYSTVASWTGITAGSATLLKTNCGLNTITFNNVASGTYTLTVTLTTPNTGIQSLGACGQLTYMGLVPGQQDVGVKEVFVENFEEGTGASYIGTSLTSHTGKKYWNGVYTASFTKPVSPVRQYKIEYWYVDAQGKWTYITKPYSGPTMSLNEGEGIDDVRIYPVDAQVTSYTYDPVLGMTSAISANGQTLIYDYDAAGRLWRIRNDKGTVEKEFTYHYSTN